MHNKIPTAAVDAPTPLWQSLLLGLPELLLFSVVSTEVPSAPYLAGGSGIRWVMCWQ
jgi:hypothetical protein